MILPTQFFLHLRKAKFKGIQLQMSVFSKNQNYRFSFYLGEVNYVKKSPTTAGARRTWGSYLFCWFGLVWVTRGGWGLGWVLFSPLVRTEVRDKEGWGSYLHRWSGLVWNKEAVFFHKQLMQKKVKKKNAIKF